MGEYTCSGCGEVRDSDEVSEVWFEFDTGWTGIEGVDYEDTHGHVCEECAKEAISVLSGDRVIV